MEEVGLSHPQSREESGGCKTREVGVGKEHEPSGLKGIIWGEGRGLQNN